MSIENRYNDFSAQQQIYFQVKKININFKRDYIAK
jgi:hypothetical protein